MESFRFLHASDFHLDQCPHGILELQEGLIDHLVDATYKSVDAVFDTAIREQVDFVLLSGNIIRLSHASPRAVEFLESQFHRLHEKKIPTYWLGAEAESGTITPADFQLPKSVHRLGSSRVQKLEVKKQRKTIAYIVGQSLGSHNFANLEDLRVPRDGRFFVGMWHAKTTEELNEDLLDDLGIDYWALGGCHERQCLETIIPAHFCGSPLGRSPDEVGPHGCLVVSVTGDQIDEARFVETDALRYRTERIEVQQNDDRQLLVDKIKSRLQTIQHDTQDGKPLLVTWEILDNGSLGKQLRDPNEYEPLLHQLGVETRMAGGPLAFTIGLRSVCQSVSSALYEEDTVLGDFLRAIREMEAGTTPMLDTKSLLPNTKTARRLSDALPPETVNSRKQLLREVTTLGIDMLTGETS